jgi:MoaA/NifB/PqqE/SkfB family radical SAM enzyme
MIVPLKSFIKGLHIVQVHLTARRMVNLAKIYLSLMLSYLLKKQIVWGYPVTLMIEPTNLCNLKCPMCPSGSGDMKRARGRLSYENFCMILDEIGSYILQLQLWNQGEPFLNKSLLDFIRYAKKKGIMVQTSTNGHFIKTDEEAQELVLSGLDQIIFSMDGTNPESYARYRVGGNFYQVMEALERIGRVKEKLNSKIPLVELQFLIFRHNEEEIENLIKIAKKNRVNRISFKTAQIYSPEQAKQFLPLNEQYSRYNLKEGMLRIKSSLPNWCKRLWLTSTVNWDGTLVPCCFDKDNTFMFSNLFKAGNDDFRTSWKSERFNRFRKRVMTERASIEICTNCTEGMKQPYTRIVELDDL